MHNQKKVSSMKRFFTPDILFLPYYTSLGLTLVHGWVTVSTMIKSFKHKGLKKLFDTGNHKGVNPEHVKRLKLILARLDASQTKDDMNLPGLSLHLLKGELKDFWAVTVSGNWRVYFRVENGNAVDVDYDDYH